MTISIELPPNAEKQLRQAFGQNLDHAAFESLILEGYRTGKLSRYKVQQILGFDNRWDTEEWLGERGAHVQYSLSDLEQDGKTLDKLLGPVKS